MVSLEPPRGQRVARGALVASLGFLCVTSVAGGIGLLTGVVAPPVEMLGDSVFSSFAVPGLALLVGVGGSAAFALALVRRRDRRWRLAAFGAACAIVLFELVEIAVIGSPAGPGRVMQWTYLGLGLFIAALAGAIRSPAVGPAGTASS